MNYSKRDFIKKLALSLNTLAFAPQMLFAKNNTKPICIQLWTVKDFMTKDAKSTIEALSKMGYTAIESFGNNYFDWSPKDFKKLVEDNGMKLLSAHSALFKESPKDPTPDNFQKSIDQSQEAGVKYMVMSWIRPSSITTEEDCKRTADYFNLYGEYCKKAAIKFLYHNHDFEFKKIGNETIYERFLTQTNPELVNFEMDLYWVSLGGANPVEIFKKHPNRFPLWHVKDMNKTKTISTEIGNGKIDFKKIFAHAKTAGLDFPIVEQEDFEQSPLISAQVCQKNIKKLIRLLD